MSYLLHLIYLDDTIVFCEGTNHSDPSHSHNSLRFKKFSPWGEHEIDYVLFYTVPSKSDLTIKGHPDEVDDVKWVTKEVLLEMMADKNLLFSPWFRLICKKWVFDHWWKDLKTTMTTDAHVDLKNIHRFDPPTEHFGGGGKAGPLFGAELEGDQR